MLGQSNSSTVVNYIKINNEDITVTQNGVYEAGQGFTGLGTVTVQVSGGVNNQNKSFAVDGSYTADPGYSGLGTVTVTAGSVVAYDIEMRLHEFNSGTNGDESYSSSEL